MRRAAMTMQVVKKAKKKKRKPMIATSAARRIYRLRRFTALLRSSPPIMTRQSRTGKTTTQLSSARMVE